MAFEKQVGTAYVSLEARGDVKADVAQQIAAAEEEARRTPISVGMSVEKVAAATGVSPEEIARALGLRGGYASPAAAGVNPMAAAMGRSAYRPPSGMAGDLSAFTRDEQARAALAGRDETGERGATREETEAAKQLLALSKASAEEVREAGKLSRLFRDLGGLLGRDSPFARGIFASQGAAGLATAGLYAAGRFGERVQAEDLRNVGLANPGAAYQAERAEMAVDAAKGRIAEPRVLARSENDRTYARALEGMRQRGEFNGVLGTIYEAEVRLWDWTGIRRGSDALFGQPAWVKREADKTKDAPDAVDPSLGRTYGSPMEYDRSLTQALGSQTPIHFHAGATDLAGAARDLRGAAALLRESADDRGRVGESTGGGDFGPVVR